MANPRFLNLDDLETVQSDIAIQHKGAKYHMRILTVDMFVAQQKRAVAHQQAVDQAAHDEDVDMGDVVAMIRDAVLEFFPDLPVGDLDTTQLFSIFTWLNELSEKVNETASEGVVDASTEKKAPRARRKAS